MFHKFFATANTFKFNAGLIEAIFKISEGYYPQVNKTYTKHV